MTRILRALSLAVAVLAAPIASAEEPAPSADTLLAQIDRNMTFDTRSLKMTMTSTNARRTRSFVMEGWGRGDDQSAIRYTAPERDAGTKMLRVGDELWMYLPSVEKVQKISGHMLRQGMMGSDVSYEDMMTANSLREDYTAKVTGSGTVDGHACWKVEMIAKDNTITYPKRETCIDKQHKIALESKMYALSGMLLKTWTMHDIQVFPDGRAYPMRMEIVDNLQTGTKTTILMENLVFGVKVPEEVFTTRWLERVE